MSEIRRGLPPPEPPQKASCFPVTKAAADKGRNVIRSDRLGISHEVREWLGRKRNPISKIFNDEYGRFSHDEQVSYLFGSASAVLILREQYKIVGMAFPRPLYIDEYEQRCREAMDEIITGGGQATDFYTQRMQKIREKDDEFGKVIDDLATDETEALRDAFYAGAGEIYGIFRHDWEVKKMNEELSQE